MEHTIPGGSEKGTPLHEASDSTLDYWGKRISGDLKENPDKQYADRDQELLRALRIEVKRRQGRGNGGEPGQQRQAAPSPSTEIPPDLMGGLSDPAAITERLSKLAKGYNLISPASACAELPPGAQVMFSFITVDPWTDPKAKDVGPDVYKQKGGKLSLKGDTLDRLANAAGIVWVLDKSGRTDDHRHPHFAEYVATGAWRTFDGSWITVSKPKTFDLREGSSQIEGISEGNLLRKRQSINENVESGARNRVIRKLGIKQAYTYEELQKPFAIVQTVFTGVSDDPDLKVPFAMLKAQQMTAGIAGLYGRSVQQAPALVGAAPPAQLPSHITVDGDGVVQGDEPDGPDEEPESNWAEDDSGDADRGGEPDAY